jgi:hypothetical protein
MDAEEHLRRLDEGRKKWVMTASADEKAKLHEAKRRLVNSKGPQHELALCWSLRSPNGDVFQFKNLVHFVRTNRSLFSEYELEERTYGKNLSVPRIVRQLIALSPRNKHPRETVRGWRWHIDGKEPETYLGILPNTLLDRSADDNKGK